MHQYWDEGAGYFAKNYKNYPLHHKQILELANQIEATYPESYFGDRIKDMNAADWAHESFAIAKSFAYNVPMHANLVIEYNEYTAQAQQISSQRIALAGYRLAYLLNEIFGGN